MSTKKSKHICKFTKTCKTLDVLYPPYLKCSKLRKRFRESLLISDKNGRKCHTPQGNAGYIFEKEKQLTQYPGMIHPYSAFCSHWENFALFEFFVGFTIRSIISTFTPSSQMNLSYQIPSFLADLFETCDVFLRFTIGYVDNETQEIILERKKVQFHVITSISFYLNLIASFPLDFAFYIRAITSGSENLGFGDSILLKILKAYTMAKYLRHVAKINNWSHFLVRIVLVLLFGLAFCHWCSCLFHTARLVIPVHNPDDSHVRRVLLNYFRCFYAAACCALGSDAMNKELSLDSWQKQFVFSCLLILFCFGNAVFIGFLLQLIALIKTSGIAFDEMKQEIQKYLAQENLPRSLHKKVIKYLEFRYRFCFFNETFILNTLSPPLRREIANFLCFKLIKNPESIFHSMPDELVSDLCLLMKFEVFLPGDFVLKLNTKCTKVYFIYTGSIAIYTKSGLEYAHLYNGHQLGIVSILDIPSLVTAIALELTECYYLRLKDFKKLTAEYPESARLVVKAAQDKVYSIAGM